MNDTVIIAGAGPAGLMLACELGLAGVETVVVERTPEPRVDAPGVAINAGTIELLDQRGLMAELREGALVLPTEHFGFLFLDSARLDRPHENTVLILQPKLEQRLERRAAELGVRIRRGTEVTEIRRTAEGVEVGVRGPAGDEVLRGRYLVGCDGRDSTVRTLAGIDFPGVDAVFHGIVGDVEIDVADLGPGQIGAFHHASGGHYLGAPLEPGVLRIMTAEFGVEPPAGDVPVGMDELKAATLRLTGHDLKTDTFRWLRRYQNTTRNADRYADGPVFLAGEAAHVHYPFNGQGIGTGVQDAVNLGWKLAATLQGWAPAGLLDTYHAERHPAGAAACANVRAQVALCHPPEAVAPLREIFATLASFEEVNTYLIELVTGQSVTYPAAEGAHPLTGRRLPHVPLTVDGADSGTAALLRPGRGTLLDLTGGRSAPATAYAALAEGFRVDVRAAAPSRHIAAETVLLRPDGHVAWAAGDGKDLDGLDAALRAWFGAPAGG
ncbi:FAD-dependent monooxygenase [Actinomadura rubrisoli]|uniref:FAD-binding domain-containing protein n=1 Tax=Actinomadura rubrisoli TaxID=2530368 RepID=A0A4R5B4M9_9ACTN|nr:FAD-dependent monooxygenase [Actinomadura rubrisoli]TDD79749.1 hypothetical protein E1298_27130 [Actinomadura rubrisoli]